MFAIIIARKCKAHDSKLDAKRNAVSRDDKNALSLLVNECQTNDTQFSDALEINTTNNRKHSSTLTGINSYENYVNMLYVNLKRYYQRNCVHFIVVYIIKIWLRYRFAYALCAVIINYLTYNFMIMSLNLFYM